MTGRVCSVAVVGLLGVCPMFHAAAAADSDGQEGHLLQPLSDPPAVQMLMPGFVVRQLPVDLTNINNVRYRPDGKLAALAYNGDIFLLSDTDGDGLEDKVEQFWESK